MLQALQTSYQVGRKTLLAPLTATLAAGQVTAILGPNGAGKSTLLSLLSGQRGGHGGEVRINGRPLAAYRNAELACLRAVMAQDTAISFDYSVQDIVELGRYPHRHRPSADEAGIVRAAMLACDVADMGQRIFTTLSGGEKARVQLARVLAQIWQAPADGATRWLLLDEPTAALDLAHQHSVMRTVRHWARDQQVGVVVVLHDLNLALRYADQVLLLQRGTLAQHGPPREVLTPASVQRVWGLACETTHAQDGVPQLLMQGVA